MKSCLKLTDEIVSDFDTVVSENEHLWEVGSEKLSGRSGILAAIGPGEKCEVSAVVCYTNYVLLPGIRKTNTTPSNIKIALI